MTVQNVCILPHHYGRRHTDETHVMNLHRCEKLNCRIFPQSLKCWILFLLRSR